MKTIAVVSQAGGVGKTTLSGTLAVGLLDKGRRVVAIDADPRRALSTWTRFGDGSGKLADVVAESGGVKALQGLVKGAKADRLVIDAPPGFGDAALAAALLADLVLIPCGPSPLDLVAAVEASELAEEARKQRRGRGPAVALVPWKTTRSRLSTDLAENLRGIGKVLPEVRNRAAFPKAQLAGRTVLETERTSAAAEEARKLVAAVERMVR